MVASRDMAIWVRGSARFLRVTPRALRSRTPRYNISGQSTQCPRRHASVLEVGYGPFRQPFGLAPGPVDAAQHDVGRLPQLGVSPRRFAQLLAGAGGVEDIIRDLERQPNI